MAIHNPLVASSLVNGLFSSTLGPIEPPRLSPLGAEKMKGLQDDSQFHLFPPTTVEAPIPMQRSSSSASLWNLLAAFRYRLGAECRSPSLVSLSPTPYDVPRNSWFAVAGVERLNSWYLADGSSQRRTPTAEPRAPPIVASTASFLL